MDATSSFRAQESEARDSLGQVRDSASINQGRNLIATSDLHTFAHPCAYTHAKTHSYTHACHTYMHTMKKILAYSSSIELLTIVLMDMKHSRV